MLTPQRFVLRLDGWERGSRYPHGHLVRLLGPINSLT
jgi:exoribonuclease R